MFEQMILVGIMLLVKVVFANRQMRSLKMTQEKYLLLLFLNWFLCKAI